MPAYFLDTNTLLRSAGLPSAARTQALDAIHFLLSSGQRVFITAQNIVEFWAVATRPTNANGFGWSVADVTEEIELFRQDFFYLDEHRKCSIYGSILSRHTPLQVAVSTTRASSL